MRIEDTQGKCFFFSLSPEDWNKYGYYTCRQFINAMKKEIPGGKGGQRFLIKHLKTWAIQKAARQKFNRLLEQYFKNNHQKGIFDG